MKYFSLYVRNNLDYFDFRNVAFGGIKDRNLKKTPFQKKFAMKDLGMCLPYVKRYFQ